MHRFFLLPMLIALSALAACQTAQAPQTPESRQALRAGMVLCFLGDNWKQAYLKHNFQVDGIVYGQKYAREGWIKIDIASSGHRINVYYDPEAELGICTDKSWQGRNNTFTEVTQQEYQQINPDRWQTFMTL